MFIRNDKVITLCEIKYVDRLASRLVEEFERKVAVIKEHFPFHGIQKVLVLGKTSKVPLRVEQHFDEILTCENIF